MRGFASILALLLALTANTTFAQASAVATVTRLYHDYAWEAVMQVPDSAGAGLMQESRSVLEHYFDTSLTQSILKDRECAKRTQEICKLDFLPIWNGQDPGASELSVIGTSDPSSVLVRFTYPSTQEKIELRYTLVKRKAGWRITDIEGPNWTLTRILGN